jgi:hypothetical protein
MGLEFLQLYCGLRFPFFDLLDVVGLPALSLPLQSPHDGGPDYDPSDDEGEGDADGCVTSDLECERQQDHVDPDRISRSVLRRAHSPVVRFDREFVWYSASPSGLLTHGLSAEGFVGAADARRGSGARR